MAATTVDHNVFRALAIDGRPVTAYTCMNTGDARRCDGHSTNNTAGYVVRHTIDDNGQVITHPDHADRVGVDVWAVATTPQWGNYDQALIVVRGYREGRSYAVIDTLYRCGHRSAA